MNLLFYLLQDVTKHPRTASKVGNKMVAEGGVCVPVPLNHLEEHFTVSWLQFLGRALLKTDPQLPMKHVRDPRKYAEWYPVAGTLIWGLRVTEAMVHESFSIQHKTENLIYKKVVCLWNGHWISLP